MGFGLPAALGAQAACPDATVVCVTGDGSLLHERRRSSRPPSRRSCRSRSLLLDNAGAGHGAPAAGHVLGRAPRGQRRSAARWTGSCVARGFGVAARSVDDADELDDALAETLAEPGPALLRVAIAPDADCLPMFRPGGPAREMVG